MLKLLDIFFLVFHSSLIVFNLFGWIWKPTRKACLITQCITAGSWLFLGLIVGSPGYCPLTDWHFNIIEKLGVSGLPNSYVKYLADRITGLDFNPSLVDSVTLWSLIVAMLGSVVLSILDYRKKRKRNLV